VTEPEPGGSRNGGTRQPATQQGASPYSSGGGGVSFERRVSVVYLSLLLTGDNAAELGDSRSVTSIAYQQAPQSPVDDLVIHARADATDQGLELAIGIRRAPNLVQSDEDSRKLVLQFVRAVQASHSDGLEHRLALVVAGPQAHALQLAQLTTVAVEQSTAAGLSTLVRTPRKYEKAVVERLDHVEKLVGHALTTINGGPPDAETVIEHTWKLLSHLSVLMPRLESPELADWDMVVTRLTRVARGLDSAGAARLRDRLEALAGQYNPTATVADLRLLRRDTHMLLEDGGRRHVQGWTALAQLHEQALASTREDIVSDGITLHLDRSANEVSMFEAAARVAGLLVHGDSGVGKSALTLHGMAKVAETEPDEVQVLCINLRHLPVTSLELLASLGCPLSELLGELSAPIRILVVDGADAAAENHHDIFASIAESARQGDVHLVAVSATESRQLVHDLLAERLGPDVVDHTIIGLDDRQIETITSTFPTLTRLAASPRSRELLRRLVVVDLLARSEVADLPLSDVDAMVEIWNGLVRNHERHDRGSPDARAHVLLQLASRELYARPATDLVGKLDSAAVDGLRRDGLLRTSTTNLWHPLPEFAHDEIRRYAAARVLLANNDPTATLLAASAPRWALAAARLACQAILESGSPLAGRFDRAQAAFDAIAEAGHGARWSDVPGEALLTLGDPTALLADAWTHLRTTEAIGLRRLLRLVDQRHRGATGFINPVIAEPIVALLLQEAAPWTVHKDIVKVLRDWLLALVVDDVPSGYPLRGSLRASLLAAADAGEARHIAEQAAAAAARAARTPEEIAKHEQFAAAHAGLFGEIGYGGRRKRRARRQLPHELTDDIFLELLALLGPDLGEGGEQLLRRVAQESPWDLAPAVEEIGTGRALAAYGHGLVADLVEAYYIDEEADGSGFHDDGIRHHTPHGLGMPLAAWYRGPFTFLFQSDPRRGIAVINRMLNHAALIRVRSLAGVHDPWRQVPEDAVDAYTIDLSITGSLRSFVGDDHVWTWYRGTGVGPYPCMSALQALERFCGQLLAASVPLDRTVALLLDQCENLAMPGLVVGVLVRHLEQAGNRLDAYLAEPAIWELEFARMIAETSGLSASSEGLVEPERRKWSFREVAAWLALHADPARADELRAVADRLIDTARRIEQAAGDGAETEPGAGDADGSHPGPTYVTTVRHWASSLDQDRYRLHQEDDVTYIQNDVPDDVLAALQPGNDDLQRGQQAMRLSWRYYIEGRAHPENAKPFTAEEIVADLEIAEDLLNDPPTARPTNLWEAPAAVAAVAIQQAFLHDLALPADSVRFAAATLLAIAEGASPPSEFEYEGTYFEQAPDRSAARALPLLLLPAAAVLCDQFAQGNVAGRERVIRGLVTLAHAVPNEARLHLARGLDPIWGAACSQGVCHHETALHLMIESMRDSALGTWDVEAQRRLTLTLPDPVITSLAAIADDALLVSRLDPAIRAFGAAVRVETCQADEARALLMALLGTHRRGLLPHEHNPDDRGTHSLVAARALLGLAAAGDGDPLFEHIDAYADNTDLLGTFLRAVTAAAEESPPLAGAAGQLWPDIVTRVIDLHAVGHHTFNEDYLGQATLAALMPSLTYESAFLYRELDGAPIEWTDCLAWKDAIEAWLPVAAGRPQSVDALIRLLRTVSTVEQVTTGLRWVTALALPGVETIARRSYSIAGWLGEIRTPSVDAGELNAWQQLVDALVVAGESTLAPYSE